MDKNQKTVRDTREKRKRCVLAVRACVGFRILCTVVAVGMCTESDLSDVMCQQNVGNKAIIKIACTVRGTFLIPVVLSYGFVILKNELQTNRTHLEYNMLIVRIVHHIRKWPVWKMFRGNRCVFF